MIFNDEAEKCCFIKYLIEKKNKGGLKDILFFDEFENTIDINADRGEQVEEMERKTMKELNKIFHEWKMG